MKIRLAKVINGPDLDLIDTTSGLPDLSVAEFGETLAKEPDIGATQCPAFQSESKEFWFGHLFDQGHETSHNTLLTVPVTLNTQTISTINPGSKFIVTTLTKKGSVCMIIPQKPLPPNAEIF
jgi:hypothetical protein